MEETIRKIILIENKAKDIIENAKKERLDKLEDLDLKINLLHDQILKDAYYKIEELRALELKEAEVKAEEFIKKAKLKLKDMESHAEKNYEFWSEQLASTVLER